MPARVIAIVVLLLALPAWAQPYGPDDPRSDVRSWIGDARTRYDVDLSRSRSQLVTITKTMRNLERDAVEVRLPTWRPGRYEILDPAGTIRTIEGVDGGGNAVPHERVDKATWRFPTRGVDELRITYTIYANSINNRTRHADATHAFLSPSSCFLYTDERRGEPLLVGFRKPRGWRVSTGLDPHPLLDDTFAAVDYDTLVDSPFEVGEHDYTGFVVRGVPHEIVIWGRHEADLEELAVDFAKIVEHQAEMYEGDGPLPYGRYVFQIHVGPTLGGGTEHLNSTIMQARPASFTDQGRYEGFLGLVSHEMYHAWNVKRLRPAGLTPYDYQRENYTDLLWVAEGTTSYYDDLTLVRTGLIDVREYLDRMEGTVRSTRAAPGLLVQSLAGSSFDAWIKFNNRSADWSNIDVNFYGQGALASLVLDLWIRENTANRSSLDDVMAELYRRHPLESGGFTLLDMADALSRVGNFSRSEAVRMLADVANTPGDLPLERNLAFVGLELTPREPDDGADIGVRLRDRDGFAEVRSVVDGRPAFDAGLIAGDLIVAVGTLRATPAAMDDLLDRTEPGDVLSLAFFRNGELQTLDVETVAKPPSGWDLDHADEPTRQQRDAYEAWLGLGWPGDESSGTESDG
ncbi:MAG: PDZ domain-containing protein [Planctomycetota bacterium]